METIVFQINICDRGKLKRKEVKGILIHTTGSGIVKKAIAKKKKPIEYAIEYYKTGSAYPHYLIDWNGDIFKFCDELKYAAHAKWSNDEKKLYDTADWLVCNEKEGKLTQVNPKIYQFWLDKWGMKRGLDYKSPKDILKQIGGKSPNEAFIGIEMLDKKPSFTKEQHYALSELIEEICVRHKLLDVSKIMKNTLPQAWLCTHSDVSPIRRWAIRKNGSGFAYDCLENQLDWNKLVKEWNNE